MSLTNDKTSQLINLQYELAMLVGKELQLVPMLRSFFPPALKALGCRAAHVWLRGDPDQPPAHCFSYPARETSVWREDARFVEVANQFAVAADQPRSLAIGEDRQLLLMPLDSVGFCALIRQGDPIDPIVVAAIRPIFKRLANACSASLRHEKVEQLKALAAERELRLRTVLETIGEVIFQADGEGRLTFLNPAWQTLTGMTITQALGHPLSEFMALSDRPRLERGLAEARDGESNERLELRLQTAHGHWKDVVVRLQSARATTPPASSAVPPGHPGKRWYDNAANHTYQLTGTIIDVTKLRQAERLKREFTATVSHELRTPLTSIVGAIGLLDGGAAGDLPPRARELVAVAGKNSQRLRQLIDDLLDMEKLLAGKMVFAAETIDVVELITQSAREHAPLADQREVRLLVDSDPEGGQVCADRHRLEQVLSNLLSNAIKFSPPGGAVKIGCRQSAAKVRIEVIDHGPGIDPTLQAGLFEPFTQADASDTRSQGGTGLGLAISRALIDQMDGRIGIESRPGQGATFWFELPAANTPAPD
ncbi:MAG: PAS domain-containing sensor histidine kinase [Wenzhouxiangella sp.]|nr:MAG: PAS domain-containing sensor histidine kinase [Wenzhouxiangella sp.]